MIFQRELIESLQANSEKIAIDNSGTLISYAQLFEVSSKITGFFLSQKLKKEAVIGILLNDRVDIICSIIGVVNARCVFVPLDGSLPGNRLSLIIEDLNPEYLILSKNTSFENGPALGKIKTIFIEDIISTGDEPGIGSITYPEYDEDDSIYVYFTSGTTGKSKGVIGKNCSLLQFLQWEISTFNINSDSRVSQFISPYFDAFLRDVFVPLLAGGTLCIPSSDEDFLSPEKLVSWIDDSNISLIHCVPSLFRVFNNNFLTPAHFKHLRYILLSGEKIIPSELQPWYKLFDSRIQLVNLYGATETTMIRAYYLIRPEDALSAKISIGSPIADTDLLIANQDLRRCKPLIPGDLYIISRYITKGYLNNPQLTEEKFIKIDIGTPYERIAFKTGDKARLLADGNIDLLGREDRQVKIRGIRIELEEIEAVLGEMDIIKNAVVIKREDKGGVESLVAFVIVQKDLGKEPGLKDTIKLHIDNCLPKYMIPSIIEVVDEYPLLSNGKINYKELLKYLPERAIELPVNEIEEGVYAIWKKILGDKPISINDTFSSVGGNSLSMMNLISQINKRFNVKLSLSELFRHFTIQKQAAFIKKATPGIFNNIPKAGLKNMYPLSVSQKRIYFLYEFAGDSLAYNMPYVVKLEGDLNKTRLAEAFNKLVARHESLRTLFDVVDKEPMQRVLEKTDFSIEYYGVEEAGINAILKDFVRPFRLARELPIRVGFIELSPGEAILMVDMHHIIADGVSQSILVKDFMSLYNDEQLAELRLQYKDYAEWQQSAEQQAVITKQKDFWLKEFSEEIIALELLPDFSRPSSKAYEGNLLNFEISTTETDQLRNISEKEGVTMYMLFLSFYNILLSKLSNQEDIVIGTPVAGRPHADLEDIIGMFVNTLPMRNYLKTDLSFKEFLSGVKARALACFEHQDYPYEELLNELSIERNTGRNPLFDVMFVYQNYEQSELSIPGMILKPYSYNHTVSKFDLTLFVFEKDGQLSLQFEYATALYKEETIERFVTCFRNIISSVIADIDVPISSIDILTSDERQTLLYKYNSTEKDYPGGNVLTLFDQQAAATPGHIALYYQDKEISYKQLKEQSEQVARYLQQTKHIKSGDLVGLMLERDEQLIPVILGIIRSGAAYVPIDPRYPAERIQAIIEDSGIKTLMTCGSLATQQHITTDQADLDTQWPLIMQQPPAPVETNLQGTDLAYVIYTSGSTGKPKGVMIEHQSLHNYISWAAATYTAGEPSTFPLYTSISFDLTITTIFTPLVTGGSIAIYGEDTQHTLIEDIFSDKISNIIKLTPSHLKILRELELPQSTLNGKKRKLIVGGEQLETRLARAIHDKFGGNIEIYNEYGPTEATIGCMIHKYDPRSNTSNVPIGQPINNTSLYIVDKNNELVPVGVPGELCIGGAGVARGYIHNETLTQEKFIALRAAEGKRVYKTGDLTRRHTDGNIEYIGRIDQQVKIRGYRIEPGEIESHLCSYSTISQSAVLCKERGTEKHLVAYYVSETPIPQQTLIDHLSGKLPSYMVPSSYAHLTTLPLTPNGKLDHKALPEPGQEQTNTYTPPVTKEEKLLSSIWSQVLGVENIGTTDNYFSLGGDSIRSIQISSRVRHAGYELPVKDIFTHPTISQQTLRLKPLEHQSDQSMITGQSPLTPIQRWFFESPIKNKHHYNQSVLLNFPGGINRETVAQIFIKLQAHHDALRMTFRQQGGAIVMENEGTDMPVSIHEHHLGKDETTLSTLCETLQSKINLETGPLMQLGLYHLQDGSRLQIVIHHLVVDGISWRILFEDIETAYRQLQQNQPLSLPPKTDPYLGWSAQLQTYQQTQAHTKAAAYWEATQTATPFLLPRDYPEGTNQYKDLATETISIDKPTTQRLLNQVPRAFNTQINDILLTALQLTIQRHYTTTTITIDLESHGREEIHPGANISRTIGWFTSIYPVTLTSAASDLSTTIKTIKETLRHVPNKGIDYLLWQQTNNQAPSPSLIIFNYLGQFDSDLEDKSYQLATENPGPEHAPGDTRTHDWDLTGIVSSGELQMSLSYSQNQYDRVKIQTLVQTYKATLEEIITHCSNYGKQELTPSDLTHKTLPQSTLDQLQQHYDLSDIYPLSPMQEGMLFHTLLDKNSGNYLEQMTYRLQGHLDIRAVETAMNQIMSRYDILRTLFLNEGYERPLQIVLKERKINFLFKDIRGECLNGSSEEAIHKYQQEDKNRKFDLSNDVLVRLTVLQTAADEYSFIWSHHHVLMDGWCIGIIVNEFKEIYSAILKVEDVSLPQVKSYSNYIGWLENRDNKEAIEYWKDYLAGYNNLATLPAKENTLLLAKLPYDQSSEELIINKDQTQQLQKMCGEYGITLNTIIQAAWGILLGRYNNVNDVVFGSVVSGRPSEIEDIEKMVGLFINTIPVRVTYQPGETIGELLRRLQDKALENEPYHYSSLSQIQSVSELGRELLDHILIFENYPVADKIESASADDDHDIFTINHVQVFEQTNYDLSVTIIPGNEIKITISYNANRYEQAIIESVKVHLAKIIRQIISDCEIGLSGIEMLSPEEEQLLHRFNETDVAYPPGIHILDLFDAQAKKSPEQVAIHYADKVISYKEVKEQSDQVCHYLRNVCGVTHGDLVGVMLERDEHLIPVIFGIMRSGGVYVPIDPHYPTARIQSIVKDSGIKALITRSSPAALQHIAADVINLDVFWPVIIQQPTTPIDVNLRGSDLAYVIYTSGSTGNPKGVMIEHHSLYNIIQCLAHKYPLDSNDSYLLKTSCSFDVSIAELFGWFISGGSLSILPPGDEGNPHQIINIIRKNGVTHINFVPSMFSVFLEELERNGTDTVNSLKYIFLAGEALSGHLVSRFHALKTGIALENIYGPTEGTIYSCGYSASTFKGGTKVPIGKPLSNIKLYILSQDNKLQPVGVPGELCISGAAVARGYLNDPELTATKFIPNPYEHGERMYKTGDYARWLKDGNIEYLGRLDAQVKIRGFRIEPGDIESQLTNHPLIRESVVICKEKETEKYLVGYYVSEGPIPSPELRSYLSDKLPGYMVPGYYIHLTTLPLTPNGKLDRKALPEPEFLVTKDFSAPSNEIEKVLARIWSEVLKIDESKISINASFFEYGGHSLNALALLNKINKHYEVQIPLKDAFENMTIRYLANHLTVIKQMKPVVTGNNEMIEMSI